MSPKKAHSGASLRAAALVLVLLGVASGQAQSRTRLDTSLDVTERYDSNAFNQTSNETSTFYTNLRPEIGLLSRGDWGSTSLNFGGASRLYRASALDAFESFARFAAATRLTPRLTATALGRYSNNPKRDFNVDGEDVVGQGRPDLQAHSGNASLSYTLTPRLTLSGGVGLSYSAYDGDISPTEGRRETNGQSANLRLSRTLSPTDSLSLTTGYNQSTLKRKLFPDFQSSVINQQISWTRAWTPRLTGSVSIGLSFLQSDSGTISNSTTGLVGGLSLRHALPRGALSFGYSRTSRSAENGNSSIEADSFSLEYSRRLSARLTLRLNGGASFQRSSADVQIFNPQALIPPITILGTRNCVASLFPFVQVPCLVTTDNAIDQKSYDVSAGLRWQLSKRLIGFGTISWRDYDAAGTLNSATYTKMLASFGFRYEYGADL